MNSKLSCKSGVPVLKLPNGQTVVSDSDKAAFLNKQFSSVFINDNGICPPYAPRSPVANVVRNMSFSPSAVYDVLYKLPNKLSSGPDGVPTQFYKILAPVLASPLASIFNLSMGTGRVPSIWSKAKVVPVFKNKGNTASPVNYRPLV